MNKTFIVLSVLLIVGLGLMILSIGNLNQPLNSDCIGTEECFYKNPVCKTYNIEYKDCVSEGYTGGLLDNKEYYVCKDYGRMAKSCSDYYTWEEFSSEFLSQGENEQ